MNYTFRMHDPRVGRFFARDPLSTSYPHNSTYAFSENKVIQFIELEGLEVYLSKAQKLDYGKAATGATEFTYNSFVSAYNGFVSIWNYAADLDTADKKAGAFGKASFAKIKNDTKKIANAVQNYAANTTPKQFKNDAKRTFSQVETYENIFGAIITTKGLSSTSKIGSVAEIEVAIGSGTVEASSLLQKFSSGASKLMSSEMLAKYPKSLTYGLTDTFVAPSAEIDVLLSQGLTRLEIATKLGIENPMFMQGSLVRIDISANQLQNFGLKITTGAEVGANSSFVAGGQTVGGVTEATVNSIPKGAAGVTKTIIKN